MPASPVLIGDTPYGTPQLENFPNDVAEINADPQVSLVIHLGDIKAAPQCTTLLRGDQADFDGFDDPLVYTPATTSGPTATGPTTATTGRPAIQDRRHPPARLAKVRWIFFPTPGRTLGQRPRRVRAQGGGYPRNVMWTEAEVLVVTVGRPGCDDDWVPWSGQPGTSPQAEKVQAATSADLVWLKQAFDAGRQAPRPPRPS